MTTMTDTTPPTPSSSSQHPPKPQRVLACILCHQRKIKCDRRFPCINCTKSGAQCVPAATAQRRRKRRFPERELLDRLRKYEELLRQHDIPFEPLHKDSTSTKKQRASPNATAHGDSDSDDEPGEHVGLDSLSLSTGSRSERGHRDKNMWHAMNHGFRDPDNDSDSSLDEVRETDFKKVWDSADIFDDHLLFGMNKTGIDLSTLHPGPVQIFKLWQIYLDNVNPVLKIVHAPTLQARIIEAAGNVLGIEPTLEALMLSVYCMAIRSLSPEDCQMVFSSPKEQLLSKYQLGCRQALCNCEFLRSGDRDCLTALYLYLISVRPSTSPQALSSVLGIAMRIAHRMGIQSESSLAKCGILEAEMRRRLWWSLVIFDSRISERSNPKAMTLDPTWDCKVPLNVNDSELRPEMKELPQAGGKSSESLFVVVRSELSNFTRHAGFHLDFTNPLLKALVNKPHTVTVVESDELVKLEKRIKDQYLRFCDQENPVHFMTTWTARGFIARCRLLEHNSRFASSSTRQTDTQLDAATSYALSALECDTMIMASPLTKRFIWLNQAHFPFPAYIQAAQDLRTRPKREHAQRAWEVMSANYEPWMNCSFGDKNPFFHVFARIILQAWEACETTWTSSNETSTVTPPGIVTSIRRKLAETTRQAQEADTEQQNATMDLVIDDFSGSMPISMDSADHAMPYGMGMQDTYPMMKPDIFHGLSGQTPFSPNMNPLDWSAFGGRPLWGRW